MASMWCFQCGSEYAEGVETCLECGVGLVDHEPESLDDIVTSPDHPYLEYEFHDWSFESRRMIEQLLTAHEIPHVWQGAMLVLAEADEDAADEIIEEVEHAMLPTLDPERETIVYEMEGWTAEQQTDLSTRLGVGGIAHEFDANGDLVIHAEDEEHLDAVIDAIEAGAGVVVGDEEGIDPSLGDVDANQVLSAVFEAADRLRRNPRDHVGVLGLAEHGGLLVRMPVPYGFERPVWAGIRDLTGDLIGLLEAERPDDEAIEEHAAKLREVVFRLV